MYRLISEDYVNIRAKTIIDVANKYWKEKEKTLTQKNIEKSEMLSDFCDIMSNKNLLAGEKEVNKKYGFTIIYEENK